MSETNRRRPPPLDIAALDRLALRYVERFSTTRTRLADYLRRKIRERGWEGALGDPQAVAERMASLGYVDDRSYAEAKAAAMGRRGLGARRIGGAFRQAGIAEEDVESVAKMIADNAEAAALAFARRRRIGPWARATPDRPTADKHLAAMLRAGHDLDLSRRIVRMTPDHSRELDDLDES
jgi:regulatory protein